MYITPTVSSIDTRTTRFTNSKATLECSQAARQIGSCTVHHHFLYKSNIAAGALCTVLCIHSWLTLKTDTYLLDYLLVVQLIDTDRQLQTAIA
jgi:hypothetical protein